MWPFTIRVTGLERIEYLLNETNSLLRQALLQGKCLMANLDRLTSEVTEISDAADAAVVLLGELSQLLRDNAADPAAITALADQLDAKGTALAAAVVANTPADPSSGNGEVPEDNG